MISALGDRMKEYEKAYNIVLPKRLPIIVRVDGKAFHTLLCGNTETFSNSIKACIDNVASDLMNEIQGAVFGFAQSDEISILVVNYSSLEYSPWFGNELQKLCSISASVATKAFNYAKNNGNHVGIHSDALFDARTFILPKEEVCNYFIWRQQDWTRNSVQMLARSLYSQNQLNDKNNEELQEMIFQKGKNWNDLETWKKRGRCFYTEKYNVQGPVDDETWSRIKTDDNPPIFTQDRNYVEKHVFIEVDDDKNSK